jgi:hypothetical protein
MSEVIATGREWAQIRAALRLWAKLATMDGTHPSRLPGVAEELSGHPPMTAGEIDKFLTSEPGHGSIPEIAAEMGISGHTLSKRVRTAGVEPSIPSPGNLYRRADVMPLARRRHRARSNPAPLHRD